MKKIYIVAAQLALALTSGIFSYALAYWVGEKYFFDKFFYYKNPDYGYFISGKTDEYTDFGKRSMDIAPYLSFVPEKARHNVYDSVLGAQTDKAFTIAVIGDSFVWGQGVKFESTITQQLERKLNKIRPTHVLSLAISGDDMVENLTKYTQAVRTQRIDLFIFEPLRNDILLNANRDRYANDLYEAIAAPCVAKTGKEPTRTPYVSELDPNAEHMFSQSLQEAYNNPTNACMLAKVYHLLPQQNAIYLMPHDFVLDPNDIAGNLIVNAMRENGQFSIGPEDMKRMPLYAKYWDNAKKYLEVSRRESHPSVLAHKMYADVLYEEITTNPRWGFVKGP